MGKYNDNFGINKEQILKMLVDEKDDQDEVFNQYQDIKENNGYSFNNEENQSLPVMHWFQESPEGRVLFLVMYTFRCKWNRCIGCNLPSQSSNEDIDFNMIKKQIDFVFEHLVSYERDKGRKIDKIILSNNGSVFDEKTFPNSSLMYFLLKINEHLPDLKKLTLETRPEFVELSELEIVRNILNETGKTEIEIAIGFEMFDDYKRNKIFQKGLSKKHFEHFVEKLAKHGFSLKTYFMLKPIVGMTEEEGVEDILQALKLLKTMEERYNIEIAMHLNPTYGALKTPLEIGFKEKKWSPPTFKSISKIINKAYENSIELHVGLYDEGLAVEGSNWTYNTSKKDINRVIEWNKTQNLGKFNRSK